MDFLEKIKGLSDEELRKVVKEKIEKLEAEKPSDEPMEIGFIVDSNPKKYDLYEYDNKRCFDLDMNGFYSGYIKKGTKIIYGLAYDTDGNARNEGNYYYLDDEEYLYEFCKFVRDKDIINEYELFDVVLVFLRKYFGVIEGDISRAEMFKLIYKDNNSFFPPVREHSITDFKGKGNAQCTEYAALSQNILSLFGIESYLVIGNEKIGNEKGECHAFNMISFDEKESGEEVNALIDFATPVNVYDINFRVLGVSPYINYLEQLNEDFVHRFMYENDKIEAADYGYMIYGNSMVCMAYERDRCYYVESYIRGDRIAKKKTL